MKTIYSLTAAAILSVFSFSSSAQTITADDSTIEGAREKISVLAHKEGMSYEILGASFKNRVYMTAKLIPASKN